MALPLHIHLLAIRPQDAHAFNVELPLPAPPNYTYTIHESSLSGLDDTVTFDAIVSPANSYARLDGGFDDAISRTFSDADDYFALTKVAQKTLYEEYRGFAPPGSCTLVRIPDSFSEKDRPGNRFQTKYLALCPTMRIPQDVQWDTEVVYECIWSLLCAIDKHNRHLSEGQVAIRTILMTPLATGTGRVSPERWAAQLVLALKHFAEAIDAPEEWSDLSIRKIYDIDDDIRASCL